MLKSTKRIATLNVRTLLQCGKLKNLKMEINKIQIYIIRISEIRWPKSGDCRSGNFRIIQEHHRRNLAQ